MNEKTKLTLYMGMFYLLLILVFGLIIINEKKEAMRLPKVKEKIINYTKEKYSDETFKYSEITSSNNKYSMKIYNKKNKHLYFTVTYQKKKITDTYKKDYLEGTTLNNYMSKKLNNELKEQLINIDYNFTIIYNTKLNNCTEDIKKELINGNYKIPIYTINVKYTISDISLLKDTLTNINNTAKQMNLIPKNYNITLNNKTNPSKSLNIIIEPSTIENNLLEIITLINNNELTNLKKYNVECTYLN